MARLNKVTPAPVVRKFKRGDSVKVRLPRGPERTGKFVTAHTTGANGTWYEIKPHEKGAESFRCRPGCVRFA